MLICACAMCAQSSDTVFTSDTGALSSASFGNAGAAPATTLTLTGVQNTDALYSTFRWTNPNITYSFPTSVNDYGGTSYGAEVQNAAFGAVSAALATATRTGLANYAAICNVTFTELTGANVGAANIRNAMSDAALPTAYAYYPSTTRPKAGDIWYGAQGNKFDNPIKGNYAFLTVIHEIGHSMGLKHPFAADAETNDTVLTTDRDSMEFSVMTYRSYIGGSTTAGYSNEQGGYAQSLMMQDIAALQAMYGANFSTNNSASVYRWDPNTGEMFINGVGQGASTDNRIFSTVWDGGGTDTYDLSNYTTNLSIDLTPGGWSKFSDVQIANLGNGNNARGNIFNALQYNGDVRSLIENAIGGSGNDVITGNAANNVLDGGAGNDTLDGGLGNDTLNGGTGTNILNGGGGFDKATYAVASTAVTITHNANRSVTITGNGFSDTLSGVENATFTDRTVSLRERGRSDFNGNGTSDIVLQSGGSVVDWIVNGSSVQSGAIVGSYVPGWDVVGTGDFNGDGVTDLLLKNGGTIVSWNMQNGSVTSGGVVGSGIPGWNVVGTGDFNGDGTSDILLQNGGTIVDWIMQNGTIISANVVGSYVPGWTVVGNGDFNGDGTSDILLQNGGTIVVWNMQNGIVTGGGVVGSGIAGWTVAGTGDFNGDGTTDILLKNGGLFVDWIVQNNTVTTGNIVANDASLAAWNVVGTGDYNGDGVADIALQNGSTLVGWNMANGLIAGGGILGTTGGYGVRG